MPFVALAEVDIGQVPKAQVPFARTTHRPCPVLICREAVAVEFDALRRAWASPLGRQENLSGSTGSHTCSCRYSDWP